MSTCKDCVHYEACCGWASKRYVEDSFDDCPHFKPKSRIVELPCAFGAVIYMLVTRKTHSFENVFKDGKRDMIKHQNQHTFIKRASFMESNFFKVLEDFGKTVFLSREEAENALAEKEQ